VRFSPWDLVFAAGAYTEDLEAAFHAILLKLIGVAAAILFASLLVAWVINRDIVGSLGRINVAMGRLSHGDLEAAVPGTDRRDEVGSMANALLVLKQELTHQSVI
jgi:methyl-accepting chemotaxis protein